MPVPGHTRTDVPGRRQTQSLDPDLDLGAQTLTQSLTQEATMERITFTKANIDALPFPEAGKRGYYGDDSPKAIRGLIVRVEASGKRAFYLSRWMHGKSQRVKVGDWPTMTVEQARKKAEKMNAEIGEGLDPSTERAKKRAEWTFDDLFKWYLEHHAKPRKKSWPEDERNFNRYLQGLAVRPLSAITRSDIRQLHAGIRAGTVGTANAKKRGKKDPGLYAANRTLALVRAVFNVAIADEVFDGANPAVGIKAFAEQSRERMLSPEELPAFFEAVDKEPSVDIRDYVLMSLYTGQRQANVLAMRWDEIDWDRRVWHIPETKNGRPLVVPLEDQELQLLRERQAAATGPWVFPGRSDGETGHLSNPARGWKRILDRAGLKDLRLHDLRRTLGSWMADGGTSLQVIGKTLGHKSHAATLIYARLSLDPVREAKVRAHEAMGKVRR